MKPNWFIGLPVRAAPWLAPLLQEMPEGLRAFHPADLHVTVAFLGGCTADAARTAFAMPTPGGPFEVQWAGLKAMGPPSRPSAFSLLVEEPAALTHFMAAHGPALREAAGTRPERYAPLPHCTVCRPPRKAPGAVVNAGVAWARGVPPLGDAATLDEIALYTWAAYRGDRLFQIVDRRPLSADG